MRYTFTALGVAAATFAFAAPFAAVAAAGPAEAQEPFEFDFTFKSGELTSIDSAETLLERLESKVRSHCSDGSGRITLEEKRNVEACVENTMARAVNRIGSPELASAFTARSDG